jgi:hypothetical protein
MPAICAQYAARVSRNEGVFKEISPNNCLGAFQFCPGTFERYFSGSRENFLNNPNAQVIAWTKYEREQWAFAEHYNLTSLIGTSVCSGNTCRKVDPSAILMGCQFGCGPIGKLAHYMQSHDCDARNVKDGNGTSVCKYLVDGAGYNVSCFTGEPNPLPPTTVVTVPNNPTGPTQSCANPSPSQHDGELEVSDGSFHLKLSGEVDVDTFRNIIEIMKLRSIDAAKAQ